MPLVRIGRFGQDCGMDDLPAASRAFLGVERSATGRRWTGPSAEIERRGLGLAQSAAIPELVGQVLAARGVAVEDVAGYLAPKLRDLMPDPSVLAGLDRAAERLVGAVRGRQKVAVFGDYDVDGAASAALLVDWFASFGIAATVHIPDRVSEGYGPNIPAMQRLGAAHDLVICVDCGTVSHDAVAAAGTDVIVLDHHQPGETLPPAIATVNPNRADDTADLGHLCAAGVVFMVLVGANRMLRAGGTGGPDLLAMLDLVALATVADVAPLTGLNRAFVRTGLEVLSHRNRPGLAALADVAHLTAPPTARDLGFALGPRLNAGGRIGRANLGVDLLTAADPVRAATMAEEMDRLNRERREIEAAVTAAATEQIERRDPEGALIWAAGSGWHPGVVGIVASRLKDRFNRPAVVIGIDGGIGKGSGRSVEGIDLGAEIAWLMHHGLITQGGGHRMAAGLTVAEDAVPGAMAALTERMAARGAHRLGPRDLRIDGAVSVGGATLDLVTDLETAGPFGAANPAPRLALPGAGIGHVRTVGQGHAQVRLTGPNGSTLDAIAFRAEDTGIGGILRTAQESRGALHIAGKLAADDWGGRRRAKLTIDDVALP